MVKRKPLILWVLAILVLLAANSFYMSGDNVEHSFTKVWTTALSGVQAVVRTQVVAGEGPLLVTIGSRGIVLLGDDGRQRRSYTPAGGVAAGATGDATGDGVDEIVVASSAAGTLALTLLDGSLKPIWSAAIAEYSLPQRVLIVDLDGDGLRDVVVACVEGHVHAVSPRGRVLWHWSMEPGSAGEDSDVRGLDDVKVGRLRHVAVARRDGLLAVLDGRGQPLWTHTVPSPIRRMRALELGGEHDSTILIGNEDGVCRQLREEVVAGQAPHFRLDVRHQIGEPVTEIRSVEVDGNVATHEVALGGKRGRVMISGAGSGGVDGKVSALAGVDLTGDARDEVIVGTEAGALFALNAAGETLGSWSAAGKVEAIVGVPSKTGGQIVVVAASGGLEAYRYGERVPPSWYRSSTAGMLGAMTLGFVALVLARWKPAAPPSPPAPPDGRLFRRQQLEAGLIRIAALVTQGQATPADAQERSDQLRAQIAALERVAPAVVAPPPPPPRKR